MLAEIRPRLAEVSFKRNPNKVPLAVSFLTFDE